MINIVSMNRKLFVDAELLSHEFTLNYFIVDSPTWFQLKIVDVFTDLWLALSNFISSVTLSSS